MTINTTCAISGIVFKTDFSPDIPNIHIPHTTGYYHPIFTLDYLQLHTLYSEHTKNKLDPTSSYLLFLAFLNSTSKIRWNAPIRANPEAPETKSFLENNFHKLLSVIAKTDSIQRVSFSQPEFSITKNNNTLQSIPAFLLAWQDNIDDFLSLSALARDRANIIEAENKLSKLILSGEPTSNYTHVIADWADIAGEFPPESKELWKKTIRACFNKNKMFNTSLTLLKEIKTYCEINIEVGSIHFHSLMQALNEGITNNINYLGGVTANTAANMLPDMITSKEISKENSISKDAEALEAIKAKAPDKPPVRSDYKTNLEFIKAKLAYRVVSIGGDT